MRRALPVLFVLCLLPTYAPASLIVSGLITQSTVDGTGPAFNNPSLNNITDFQTYTLTLDPATAITGAGFYDLTGSALSFVVPSAPASETMFGVTTLSITSSGGLLDFSLLACIAGADCSVGNALSASFSIPSGSFNGLNVAATGLDQPHPFELLEDDGITDIHGSITTYSNTSPTTVVTPEPSSGSLVMLSLLIVATFGFFRTQRSSMTRRSL